MFKKLLTQYRTKALADFPSDVKCVIAVINHKGNTQPATAHREMTGGKTVSTVTFDFEYPHHARIITNILDQLILSLKGMDRPVAPLTYRLLNNTTLEVVFNKTRHMCDGPSKAYANFAQSLAGSFNFA